MAEESPITDVQLIQLWGKDLYDYTVKKSTEIIGYPEYHTMVMCAIQRLQTQITLGGPAIATS